MALKDKEYKLLCRLLNAAHSNLSIYGLQVETPANSLSFPKTQVVLRNIPASGDHPGMMVRLAGDRYVMVEYGPMELDLNLRVRVWALEKFLKDQQV